MPFEETTPPPPHPLNTCSSTTLGQNPSAAVWLHTECFQSQFTTSSVARQQYHAPNSTSFLRVMISSPHNTMYFETSFVQYSILPEATPGADPGFLGRGGGWVVEPKQCQHACTREIMSEGDSSFITV